MDKVTSKRGEEFRQILLREYRGLASYYKAMASMLKEQMGRYTYDPFEQKRLAEEIRTMELESERWALTVREMEGGEREDGVDLRQASMPERVRGESSKFTGIECTTVL